MKQGTKSLLFGVHHIIWHPFTVCLAWIELYGKMNFREFMAICVHDLGYFGKSNMDGAEGKKHPELGAQIMSTFGKEYSDLCLFHSRSYAKIHGSIPSKLCWADKLSIKYETWWTYLPRAVLSGELNEYKMVGSVTDSQTNKEWFFRIQEHLVKEAYNNVNMEDKYSYNVISDVGLK